MRIKNELTLLGRNGLNFNIYTLSRNSLEPYIVDNNDVKYLHALIQTYEREKKTQFTSLMNSWFDRCVVVKIPEYSLPGTSTINGTPIVNLSILNATYLSDYRPPDVYACFLYSILFANYIKNKPFNKTLAEQVSLFIFNVFMARYGKQQGLIGSYASLIPKLRLLIVLYVYDCMFGIKADHTLITKMCNTYGISKDSLKLDYDFSDPVSFITSIRENRIMNMSENTFTTDIIKVSGVASIPMYEDISRLFSTILTTSISGNSIFINYWAKKAKSVYEKMMYYGLINLKK
jgi:hypothetical protein